jgi:hypothetical protein
MEPIRDNGIISWTTFTSGNDVYAREELDVLKIRKLES